MTIIPELQTRPAGALFPDNCSAADSMNYLSDLTVYFALFICVISRIETGKYMPTIENLLKLSEILDVGLDYFLYDLLPHNKDIQSPAIQDAISIMNQMGERQTEYIVKILKIYQASHQD